MSNWYYTRDGQQTGPISEMELKSLVADGRLAPGSLAWTEGMADWKAVSSIPALTQAPPNAAAEAPAPGPAGASLNPYAAPSPNYDDSTSPASIDLPEVRAANFGLFATFYIVGCLAVMAGYGLIFAEAFLAKGETSSDETFMVGGAVAGIGFIPLLIGGIMSLIYLHRAWVLLQPQTHYATPGKAVGFLFIPLFNLYWSFVAYWRWAQEWNRIVASNPKHQAAPRASEGLFLTYPILNIAAALLGIFALLPIMIVFLMLMRTVCNVVNYAARK